MKKIISITLLVLALLNLNCSGVTITGRNIKKELLAEAKSIQKNRSLIYTLDRKKVGITGYYYIIGTDGRITYHPKKALINFNFSEYPFAEEILKKRNGCVTFTGDGMMRHIFFCELDETEILCLTISSDEIDESLHECESVTENNQ